MIECKICGNMFESDDKRYKCCSAKCSKINQLQHIKRWYKEHKDEERERKREYKRQHYVKNPNQTPHYCRICGETIRWTNTKHPVMHDECVFNEIIKCVNAGKKLKESQYQQLIVRGYELGSFAEDYRKVLKYYPTVEWKNKK